MVRLVDTAPQSSLSTESAASQRARGKLARKAIPREELGTFVATERDPVALVAAQNQGRVARLIPLRHERMSASVFTFFRGTAGLMAFDLAQQPQTETQLVICGDAHINNFGLYASPERRLVFDLNDFDEAAPGPWEWDVKRLLTSAALAAKENGAEPKQVEEIVLKGAREYRTLLRNLLKMPSLERHYLSVDSSDIASSVRRSGVKAYSKQTEKAQRRDSDRVIAHLMAPDRMGFIRFKENPPVLTHVRDELEGDMASMFHRYQESTLPEIDFLLTRFTLTDIAMRVVGVGSVGTRCYVLALTGPEGRGLVLQVKEARQSVVAQYSTPNVTTPQTITPQMSQGERVIVHQRILQAVSDPFLGHLEGHRYDFYVRQFRDSKGSFDTTQMDVDGLSDYVSLCALMLARAHSQSPLAHWVSGYLGNSEKFDHAMVSWSMQYAQQAEEDYAQFMAALRDGKLETLTGDAAHSVSKVAQGNGDS